MASNQTIDIPWFVVSQHKHATPKLKWPIMYLDEGKRRLFGDDKRSSVGNNCDKFDYYGLYAYLLQHESSPTNVTLVLMSRSEVRDVLLNPKEASLCSNGVVRITNNGKVKPAYLLDLSELILLPRVIQVLIKWHIESGIKLPSSLRHLMKETNPSLPSIRYCSTLEPRGKCTFTHYSGSDELKFVQVLELQTQSLFLKVSWDDRSSSQLDGRVITGHIEVCDESEGKRKFINSGPPCLIMLWNCRGVNRPSFGGHMGHLLEGHKPTIVILTETKAPNPFVQLAVRDMGMYRVSTIDPCVTVGGVAVLSTSKLIQFYCISKSNNSIYGKIMGNWDQL